MCRICTSSSSSILTISDGVIDATPAHVRDVQQAVDAAQVDKGTKVGDVLDHTLAELADFQLFEQFRLLLAALGFNQAAAADDDVAASVVDFQHHALDRLAECTRQCRADGECRPGWQARRHSRRCRPTNRL